LVATQTGDTTPFDVEPQGASIYVRNNPAPGDPAVRQLQRDVANIAADNPFSGVPNEKIVNYQAGKVEQRILHIETADPLRTPTFTIFPKGDYFFSQGPTNCNTPCVSGFPRFAWDHGYYEPNIDITWAGLVGPNVAVRGLDGPDPSHGPAVLDPNGNSTVPQFSNTGTWADETDTRPTMLSLVGLKDDYTPDGRVLTEILDTVPQALRGSEQMATCYKQLNASVGEFGTNTLLLETRAAASGSAGDDHEWVTAEQTLTDLANQRDALATDMKNSLAAAAFDGVKVHAPGDQMVQCRDVIDASRQALGA
jgi:hypothetical protein